MVRAVMASYVADEYKEAHINQYENAMNSVQELRALREEIRQEIAALRAMITEQNEEILDIDAVVRLTKLAKSSVYQLTSMHLIPFYRRGKRLYFKHSEIVAWLTARRVKTNDEIRTEAAYLSRKSAR
jgi:predicted DNA-binding transcriptional regulator AlpA